MKACRFIDGIVAGLFVAAYGLWNVDNLACERLRGIRHTIGLPWAWLLELHGWYVKVILICLRISSHRLSGG